MAEEQFTPSSTSNVPLIDVDKINKLTAIVDTVGNVISNREQLSTIMTTLIVSNLLIAIVNSFTYGVWSAIFPFFCFIFILAIYVYGFWSIYTESYPNLILFAGLLILIRLANLFSFPSTDNILLSLGIIMFIVLNEIFVVQERRFPSGKFDFSSWSANGQNQSSMDNQDQPPLSTINID